MTRSKLLLAYALLFPVLGIAYVGLMLVGQIGTPPFELESLRPFGGPSLANLIEIPIAAAAGGFAALLLLLLRAYHYLDEDRSIWRYVRSWYVAGFVFYMLMPTLPE